MGLVKKSEYLPGKATVLASALILSACATLPIITNRASERDGSWELSAWIVGPKGAEQAAEAKAALREEADRTCGGKSTSAGMKHDPGASTATTQVYSETVRCSTPGRPQFDNEDPGRDELKAMPRAERDLLKRVKKCDGKGGTWVNGDCRRDTNLPSLDWRMGKRFMLLGELPGMGFGGHPVMFSYGATAGYLINEWQMIQLSVMSGEAAQYNAKESATVTALSFRQFLTDTFNVSLGLGHRSMRFDWYLKSYEQATTPPYPANRDEDNRSTFTRTDVGWTAAVGNLWALDGDVTMGLDWVGVFSRVKTLSETAAYADGADKAFVDSYYDRYVGSPDHAYMIMLTRFYVGMTF